MKRISFLFIFLFVLLLTGCSKTSDKLTIVTTNFPCYDFVKAIVKDSEIEIKMLLKPGIEMHDYEPTPQDIVDISKSDLFVYIGGESDYWVNDILKDLKKDDKKVVKLIDYIETLNEEEIEGIENDVEEEAEEIDEHIWTSPVNAIKLVNELKDKIKEIDEYNSEKYEFNANNYINEIKNIDNDIKDLVKNSKRNTIVFADRFPILYFVKEYGLNYYAAFPGCSHEVEASAKTISFLIEKIKELDLKVIFHIELSNTKVAETISKETNTKVLEFHTAHNISKIDFDSGLTYVDIMKNNYNYLKEALN